MKKRSLLFSAIIALFCITSFCTCTKKDSGGTNGSSSCNLGVTIQSDSSTVSPYGEISLYAKAMNEVYYGTTYEWSGPNGFSAATSGINIMYPKSCAAGNYTVTIKNGTCTASATYTVAVGAVKPPKTVATNTMSGLANTTFKTITANIADGHFNLSATDNLASANELKFTFYDIQIPVCNKIYYIANQSSTGPMDDPSNVVVVGHFDQGGFTDEFDGISGFVYFTIVNGKYSATMCDLNMASQNFSGTVSANITSK